MIEYVESLNACEMMGGRDMLTTIAPDEETARKQVCARLKEEGYPVVGYSVLGVLPGHFPDSDAFCSVIRAQEEEMENQVIAQMEEDSWEAYVEKCESEENNF